MPIKSNRPQASYFDFFSQSGLDAVNPEPPPKEGLDASGGFISDYTHPDGNIYRCHIFTHSDEFIVSALGNVPAVCDYVVIAGGGGSAGGGMGGGGGAGGMTISPDLAPTTQSIGAPWTATAQTYVIRVGAGGYAGNPMPNPDNPEGWRTSGARGGESTVETPTAVLLGGYDDCRGGGGGSTGYPSGAPGGLSGGSGGGSNRYDPNPGTTPGGSATTGPPGPTPRGYAGGAGITNAPSSGGWSGGGGGGGAGGVGADGTRTPGSGNTGGAGGVGLKVLIGSAPTVDQCIGMPGPGDPATFGGWFAGGGGGGQEGSGPPTNNTNGQPPGGGGAPDGNSYAGGGKANDGNSPSGPDPQYGMDSKGISGTGGGGGSTSYANPKPGGSGGPGIVAIRYQISTSQTSGGARATGGAISYYNGQTIHTFLHPGTFATSAPWSPTATVEYVVIAGGGSGGAGGGGGGGAGGYITNTTTIPGPSSFAITVGQGGQNVASVNFASPATGINPGYNGEDSVAAFPAGTQTAVGGGYGGSVFYAAGAGGSAGGGGSSNDNGHIGGASPTSPTQGYGGGDGIEPVGGSGGGGGGAGAVGYDANTGMPQFNCTGGLGIELPATFRDPIARYGKGPGTPSPYWWVAGGGAGGKNFDDSTPVYRQGAGGGAPTGTPTVAGEPSYSWCGGGCGGKGPTSQPEQLNPGSAWNETPTTPDPSPYTGQVCGPTAFLPENYNGQTGAPGTGGGGGGGSYTGSSLGGAGGGGGSGIVLIAYPT